MKGSGDFLYLAEAVAEACRHNHGALNCACRGCIASAIEDAVKAEREACARLADPVDDVLAGVMRARGAAQDPTPGEGRER